MNGQGYEHVPEGTQAAGAGQYYDDTTVALGNDPQHVAGVTNTPPTQYYSQEQQPMYDVSGSSEAYHDHLNGQVADLTASLTGMQMNGYDGSHGPAANGGGAYSSDPQYHQPQEKEPEEQYEQNYSNVNGVEEEYTSYPANDPDNPTVDTTTEYFSSYSIPNSTAITSASPLPMGMLLSPAVRLQPAPPSQRRKTIPCAKCGAILNSFVQADKEKQEWKCVFCRNVNALDGLQYATYDTFPELSKRVVEYMDVDISSSPPQGVPYIFVVDANASKQGIADLKDSLARLLESLPSDALVGLVSFSNIVSVYDMSVSGLASCEVLAGHLSPHEDDISDILNDLSVVGPLSERKETLLDCLTAIEAGCHHDNDSGERLLKPRCIGPAVEVALNVACSLQRTHMGSSSIAVNGGHVIVCTEGAPDVGPGSTHTDVNHPMNQLAKDYYETLGLLAQEHCCTVSVFCSGMGNFSLPVLRSLVSPNGGSLLIHHHFKEQFWRDLWLVLFRACGFRGSLQVQTSPGIIVTRIIGGVTQIMSGAESGIEKEKQTLLNPNANVLRFRMAAVNPDECFTFYFDLEDGIPNDYVYFQTTLSYTDLQQNVITRVITRRIRTTGNLQTYLKSVDANVTCVLIAKRSVLMTTKFSEQQVLEDLYVIYLFIFIRYCCWLKCLPLSLYLALSLCVSLSVSLSLSLHLCLCMPPFLLKSTLANQRVLPDANSIGMTNLKRFVPKLESVIHTVRVINTLCTNSNTTSRMFLWRMFLASYFFCVSLYRLLSLSLSLSPRLSLFLSFCFSVRLFPSLCIIACLYITCRLHLPFLTFASKLSFPFPLRPPLHLHRLFHLRRGPLLGPIMQHPDDINAIRMMFLQSNLVDSMRIIKPVLLSFDYNGEFEQLPLETLALQSGRILMLDHHTHVFIWSGKAVKGIEYEVYRDVCRERAANMCKYRLPCAEVLVFEENTSQARWLECRLIPSHKDTNAEQLASFPQLSRLSDEGQALLRSKFTVTDELSFREYFRNLFL